MPTGYTAAVVEGKCETFREFAMTCARAFGATITMRDDPMSKPIPDEFKPDSYYQRSVIQSEEELANLLSLSETEKASFGQKNIDSARESNKSSNARFAMENERVDSMLEKVKAWEPPSPDHVEMKKFMIDQLEMSKHTWFYHDEPKATDPIAEYDAAVIRARERVEQAKKSLADEIERCAGRTQWVRQLRESLKA